MNAATAEVDSRSEGREPVRPDAGDPPRPERRELTSSGAGEPVRPAGRDPLPRPLAAFAYLDVVLVVLALPLVLLAGGPLIGYAAGAAGWILQRAVGAVVDRFARGAADPKTGLIAALAGLFLRLWIVVLAIIVAARLGEREDGLTATVVIAVAFTVYLAMSLLIRPPGLGLGRRAPGR